jgi:excisionase family DNA binding protein
MLVADLLSQGRTVRQVARRLRRTETAVRVWLKRNGGARAMGRPYSARDVQRMLGLSCSKQVARWIERGALCARRSERAGAHRRWAVDEFDLVAFLEDSTYWHEWEPGRVEDRFLREWAIELRGGQQFLLLSEVAERFGVVVSTVSQWVQRGDIPTVRLGGGGNHLVPASALVGFEPPYARSRAGGRRRVFTPDEDARLLSMRASGHGWTAIGNEIDRHPSVVLARWRRLTLAAAS